MGETVAVVLAAGESRRMGTLKPLLPYASSTVLQTVVRSLTASPVDRIVVVLGHRSEEIRRTLEGTDAEVTVNADYAAGMLTSLQAGIRAVGSAEAWLVAMGDQPAIEPETVRRLRASRRESGAGIVIPTWQGRRGHPILLDGRFTEEVCALPAEGGLRALLLRYPEAIRQVEVGDDSVLRDMDTPEDYQRELGRLEGPR